MKLLRILGKLVFLVVGGGLLGALFGRAVFEISFCPCYGGLEYYFVHVFWYLGAFLGVVVGLLIGIVLGLRSRFKK